MIMIITVRRIYLSYHTISQIVCGIGAGCVVAVLWFLLVHIVLTPFFPHICSWLVDWGLFYRKKEGWRERESERQEEWKERDGKEGGAEERRGKGKERKEGREKERERRERETAFYHPLIFLYLGEYQSLYYLKTCHRFQISFGTSTLQLGRRTGKSQIQI